MSQLQLPPFRFVTSLSPLDATLDTTFVNKGAYVFSYDLIMLSAACRPCRFPLLKLCLSISSCTAESGFPS